MISSCAEYDEDEVETFEGNVKTIEKLHEITPEEADEILENVEEGSVIRSGGG